MTHTRIKNREWMIVVWGGGGGRWADPLSHGIPNYKLKEISVSSYPMLFH